jgi:hypothetical protein
MRQNPVGEPQLPLIELWHTTTGHFFEAIGPALPLPPKNTSVIFGESTFQVGGLAWGLTAAEVAAPSDEVWRQLLINCGRLISRVRRVTFRIRVLNLSTAFGAMRRSLLSLEMLNPRNLGSSGRATALIVSLTHGFGLSCGASLALTDCAAREYERRSSQCKDQESTEHISCSPKIVDEPSCVPRNRS